MTDKLDALAAENIIQKIVCTAPAEFGEYFELLAIVLAALRAMDVDWEETDELQRMP